MSNRIKQTVDILNDEYGEGLVGVYHLKTIEHPAGVMERVSVLHTVYQTGLGYRTNEMRISVTPEDYNEWVTA